MGNFKIPDPPWIGLSEEDFNEQYGDYHDDEYYDHLEDIADEEYHRMKDEGEI